MQHILANRPPTPNAGGAGFRAGVMSPQNWGLGGLMCRNASLIWYEVEILKIEQLCDRVGDDADLVTTEGERF